MIGTLFKAFAFYGTTLRFFGGVSDCAPGASVFTVNSVSLEPAVPIPGQNVTLTLDYTVPDGVTVTGGETEYDITWNYIPFEPSYEPLCQDIPCPLGSGRYTNRSTSVWPDSVSGYVTSQMKWLNEAKEILLCVEISGQAGDPRRVALVQTPGIQAKQVVPYYHRHLRGYSYRDYAEAA